MVTDYFDTFVLGQRYGSRNRTITETDLVLFSAFSGDWYPLHSDVTYAASTRFGQRIAHGLLILSVASGLLRLDPEFVQAFYGMDRVRFTAPTFIGDTVHVETVVVDLEERDATGGVVTFSMEVKKENGQTVLTTLMKILVTKRENTGGADTPPVGYS